MAGPDRSSGMAGIRINLLPPEIIEKRKAESRRLVFIAIGVSIIALIGIGWAFLALAVGIKTGEVVAAQQQAANLRAQAETFRVFEDRGRELQSRQAVADLALGGRISWSRIMAELSLILPPAVWMDSFNGVQTAAASGTQQGQAPGGSGPGGAATLALTGWSLDVPVDKSDGGFKSLAQLLVRLNDLDDLRNVWLTSGQISTAGFRGQDAIKFESTSEVVVPSGSESSPTVPGKP